MLDVALRHGWPGGFTLDVAFAAPAPGVTGLFGPSGCGKSTILACVAGLLRPREGRITLHEAPLLDTARRLEVPAEKRGCGVVFQDARLFPHMTVESNLRYGARRAPPGEGPGFEEVVALLGIAPLLQRRPGALSGGEKQRVALGRALLARPRLLLMDEPLAALDTPRRAEVLPFLARLRDVTRVPILFVTHALDEVDALADQLVLLEGGRVQARGPIADLSARTDLPQLSARRDAGAVLACTVLAHDQARGLTRLGFPGGELLVPLRAEAAGTPLRFRLRARDVVVATEAPRGISVNNVLPAVLESVAPAGAVEAFLRLRIGPSIILSRVTRDSVSRLGLTPGMAVFALMKSVTFDHSAPRG